MLRMSPVVSVDLWHRSVLDYGSKVISRFGLPSDMHLVLKPSLASLVIDIFAGEYESRAVDTEFLTVPIFNLQMNFGKWFHRPDFLFEYERVLVDEANPNIGSGFQALIRDPDGRVVARFEITTENIALLIFGDKSRLVCDRVSIGCYLICSLCKLVPKHCELVRFLADAIALTREAERQNRSYGRNRSRGDGENIKSSIHVYNTSSMGDL